MDSKKAKSTVSISLTDAYQLLINEMRYGYGRNNHLMPSCGYDTIKRLIPLMYKADKNRAINTMRQLCEECISDQIVMNFYDGEDDEFGNREDAIDFVKYSLKWIHEHDADPRYADRAWLPYNYDLFLENLAKDDLPRYNVYEIKDGEKVLLTESPASQNSFKDFVFGGLTKGTYRRETHRLSEDYKDRRKSYTYHILAPFVKDFYVEHI